MLVIVDVRVGDNDVKLHDWIVENMTKSSQHTMPSVDNNIIYSVCLQADGDHLEIGVLDGGSAITAGLAKLDKKNDEHVYGLDVTIRNRALENIERCLVKDYVTLYEQRHPPLPPELEEKTFASTFIDGDHSYDACKADWMNIKDRVTDYIIFHDVQHSKYGSRRVFLEACEDPEWVGLLMAGKVGIVERVK